MPDLHLTAHALERCAERCPGLDPQAVLTSAAVHTAVAFGAPFVRLATGQRIVLNGWNVVTVLPSNVHPGTLHASRRRA